MIHSSRFQPPWWARNPHLQTILARTLHRTRQLYQNERLELPDGDFVDLAWATPLQSKQAPLVVLFHGLEGCVQSHYVQGMMAALHGRGWQPVLMHFRGCSGEPNRLLRAYHSGAIEDPAFVLQVLRRRFPGRPMAAIGYSLGGNMLVNYLASHRRNPLCAAVVVSAPLQLAACADRIGQGLSRLYQRYLLGRMKHNWQRRLARHRHSALASSVTNLARVNSLRAFDDHITAPLHGFADADDYYRRCSGLPKLADIITPTLVLHAADDPFMTDAVIPEADALPPAITYELSRHGGHVGFMQGRPWRPRYWLEQRVPAWLEHHWPPTQETP
ncbi:hydrolase [Oceanimonas sp. CHS3-5]|uniref:hydrolase n=1 Tax=Oceanimonas sp. CHS3-5 TaxID=3068186 RepID=UPI00273FA337|nr:hydrolase [Oceanimonas sp. CHS3-5]MDP5293484.1 hydrolase [Oceanimonas sp. CHS3-5]